MPKCLWAGFQRRFCIQTSLWYGHSNLLTLAALDSVDRWPNSTSNCVNQYLGHFKLPVLFAAKHTQNLHFTKEMEWKASLTNPRYRLPQALGYFNRTPKSCESSFGKWRNDVEMHPTVLPPFREMALPSKMALSAKLEKEEKNATTTSASTLKATSTADACRCRIDKTTRRSFTR